MTNLITSDQKNKVLTYFCQQQKNKASVRYYQWGEFLSFLELDREKAEQIMYSLQQDGFIRRVGATHASLPHFIVELKQEGVEFCMSARPAHDKAQEQPRKSFLEKASHVAAIISTVVAIASLVALFL